MSQCPICLEVGGVSDACDCPATIHINCLAGYIDKGFAPRCPNCFARVSASTLAKASAFLYDQDPCAANLFNLAADLTFSGSPLKALALLDEKATDVGPRFAFAINVEQARALVKMKMMNSALDSLVNAFADATEETLIPQCLFAQALMLTSEAYMGLDKLPLAEAANEVALKISRCLPLEERLNILLVTVELSKRANDIPKLLAARHHIYDLIKAEEKDPYIVAQVSFFFLSGWSLPSSKKEKK